MIYRTAYDYSIKDLEFQVSEKDDLSNFYLSPKDHVYTLGISLTRKCNFNCQFCYYHQPDKKSNDNSLSTEIDINLLVNVLDSLPIMSCINVSLEGEPLCHTNFLKCIDLLQKHADKILLTTNGSLLSEAIIKQLCNYNLDIVLSFESSDTNNYEFLRKGSKFSNICKVIERLNFFDFNYAVYSILFKENLLSYLQFPKLARDLNIKKVAVGSLRECPNSKSHKLHRLSDEQLLIHVPYLWEQFSKYGVSVEFDPYLSNNTIYEKLLSDGIPFSQCAISNQCFCNMPWFYTSILSDGSIFPCCGDFLPIKLDKFTFDSIFNNKYLLLLRKLLFSKKLPCVCLQCRNLL